MHVYLQRASPTTGSPATRCSCWRTLITSWHKHHHHMYFKPSPATPSATLLQNYVLRSSAHNFG